MSDLIPQYERNKRNEASVRRMLSKPLTTQAETEDSISFPHFRKQRLETGIDHSNKLFQ